MDEKIVKTEKNKEYFEMSLDDLKKEIESTSNKINQMDRDIMRLKVLKKELEIRLNFAVNSINKRLNENE